ncbi:MAG TPA: hypothetical protein PLE74_02730 [Candidatus Cloacimonadota bacterium]|nr:hypothetical protein [Candidatus Cloacimonadota bacterium]
MKTIWLFGLWIILIGLLSAVEIPFSTSMITNDSNHFSSFVRIDPNDQKAESLPTNVLIWYDEENLYALFNTKIDSTFTKGKYASRDNGSEGDYLYLYVIPSPSSFSDYFYLATPSGALSDGTSDINNGTSYLWDSSYSYSSEITDSTWIVRMVIPFRDIRFSNESPYQWKVSFMRYNEFNREYYVYPYYDNKVSKDFYAKAIDIELKHKIKRHHAWKFRPYYVKSYDLIQKTSTYDPDNIGLDMSFNPDTRTKMKITLNPDFTDVPPDDAEDIYNEKYPTFYSENRYFFIEDIDAFGVDTSLFNSRNIVQPQFALKYTGNSETWTYGYLCAKDKKITEDGAVVNPDDFYQLAAVSKQGNRYSFHFAGASRTNEGYYNHFVAGDGKWEPLKKLHLSTSYLVSTRKFNDSSTPDNEIQRGSYYQSSVEYLPGNWDISFSNAMVEKDVALDMGYLYDPGYISYDCMLNWKSDPKERFFRKIFVLSDFVYGCKTEPHHPFDVVGGNASLIIGYLPKFTTMVQLQRDRSVFQKKEHDTYQGLFNIGYNKWAIFHPTVKIIYGQAIVYTLNETKKKITTSFSGYGNLKQSLSWSASVSHYEYGYPTISYIHAGPDTIPITMDNSYEIINASLDYSFSNSMSINNGLNISTYKSGQRYSDLTYYTNFKYEFRKDWFLYIGYKTSQCQDEPSDFFDLQGHFDRYSASAYMKISLTL